MGRRFAELAEPGDVVSLRGDLGAGKTQMVKGIAEGLGVTAPILSPTFVLLREYRGRLELFHLDLYRGNEEVYLETGAPDFAGFSGLTVIEWGDRVEALLDRSLTDFLSVEITLGDGRDDRNFALSEHGPRSRALAEGWARLCTEERAIGR